MGFIKQALRKRLSTRHLALLDSTRALVETIGMVRGKYERECPICGYNGRFRAAGVPLRLDAQCPHCWSLERHRLFCLALARFPLTDGAEVLHFAPEPAISRLLRGDITTTDLFRDDVAVQDNIEALNFADGSFDAVVCIHVLEHVDDRRALRELFRVLRPGATLYAMVPIYSGYASTYEVATKNSAERLARYGHKGHLRAYGRDAARRFRDAGFDVETVAATPDDIVRHALLPGDCVFIARVPEAPQG